jgi:hypothetical protein
MSRLTMGWILILATGIVGATMWYVIKNPSPQGAVVAGLASSLSALAAKGVFVAKYRNEPSETPSE